MLEKCLEDSLGDEGYAAWLQYREIQRYKRDREAMEMEAMEVHSREGLKVEPGKSSQWVLVPDKGEYSGGRGEWRI